MEHSFPQIEIIEKRLRSSFRLSVGLACLAAFCMGDPSPVLSLVPTAVVRRNLE